MMLADDFQELTEEQRADSVNSMVYEANARIQDPVYGCTGAICLLQKQINELQSQVAMAKAEILNIQCQNDNLVSIIANMGMGLSQHHQDIISDQQYPPYNTNSWVSS